MSFELDRRYVVERHLEATVNRPFQILKRLPFHMLDVASCPIALDWFGLAASVEILCKRIYGSHPWHQGPQRDKDQDVHQLTSLFVVQFV